MCSWLSLPLPWKPLEGFIGDMGFGSSKRANGSVLIFVTGVISGSRFAEKDSKSATSTFFSERVTGELSLVKSTGLTIMGGVSVWMLSTGLITAGAFSAVIVSEGSTVARLIEDGAISMVLVSNELV